MNKLIAIQTAKATGQITISERTADLLFLLSQMEELAEKIYGMLETRYESDMDECEALYQRMEKPFENYLSRVREEVAKEMAENLSFREFSGL